MGEAKKGRKKKKRMSSKFKNIGLDQYLVITYNEKECIYIYTYIYIYLYISLKTNNCQVRYRALGGTHMSMGLMFH